MEALGPILILLSIPLIFRWIPRNHFYGLRVPATMSDESIWYDANALCGRHLFVLGVVMVVLDFLLSRPMRAPVLGAIGAVGSFGIITVDWRTANRWRRERNLMSERSANRSKPGRALR
jgi:uncharacterized membrane protein